MKNSLLLLVAVLASHLLFANNYTDYTQHIAKDRLLLIFDKNVAAETKEGLIKASGLVTTYVNLPAPAVTICYTSNFEAAQKFFTGRAGVVFVSFFITDGLNNYAGVLNSFSVKLTDKNFEPLLREKLKQLNLAMPVADKYIPNLFKVSGVANNTIDVCAAFVNQGWVAYATPNYLLNPLVNTDPLYTRQWHINNTGSAVQGHGIADADMDVDSAWTLTTGDPNIKVGVVDSGVDTLHEDLVQNLLPGHDAITDSTDGYPTPNFPEDGHGTCCSGIIAAVKDNNKGGTGVAPGCKIIPVRAFYYIEAGPGTILPYSTSDAFADAIGWSWSIGQADVLSNSWGLPPSLISFLAGGTQPVDDAILTAYTNGRNGKGLAMFFSSGNENGSAGPIWPGSLPQTIAVNATNMCDSAKTPGDCSGENWGGDHGTGLDFSAPGVKITTTDMTGANGFSANAYTYTFNGTSAACPNAAAVGALLLSLRADLSAEDIRNIIALSCDRVTYNYATPTATGPWGPELGHGRVNAFQALKQALVYTGINSTTALVNELKIFPNPATGLINIQYNSTANTTAHVYTITGAEVATANLQQGLNKVDVSSLPAGLYLVKVAAEGVTVTQKVTVFR